MPKAMILGLALAVLLVATSQVRAMKCPAGYADCDRTQSNKCETNIQTNANNCGACGKVCSLPNATSACVNGSCQVSACSGGHSDCDGNSANGCESNIQNDVSNCGACGRVCAFPHATAGCMNGNCTIAGCSAGYLDCNGMPQDGCEIRGSSCP